MPADKQRLDLAVVERGLARSRQRAKALIMEGKIRVNDQPVDKPGTLVSPNDHLYLKGKDIAYVSRGGVKLESALKSFKLNVDGFFCLDVGASTGGFTDCLLQQGAKRVFAVDVGYGQLAWKLRQDQRVVVIERTNIRYMSLTALPRPVDLITIDVSFISLKTVVPAVTKFMKKSAVIVALIKPQFEVGRGKVGKGGVVRHPDLHQEVIAELTDFFLDKGFLCKPAIPSPILGPKGNREFFIHLKTIC
ncbi:MAG: TlyA family RNA methyltransferase [Thermodesulfobacteriota bacterium]|nr:TlyA family RNA methyltransferase [Thermodesulfobacteriota bacterium]